MVSVQLSKKMDIRIVKSSRDGVKLAKKVIYKNCDKNTVLFLSGGSTPKPLYELLVKEKKLKAGALAMVDDRYSLHEQYSNEFMIRESGFIQFVEKTGGAFFPILEYGLSLAKTAQKYDDDVRFLFDKFPKRIAILGIGNDGHIASLPAGNQKSKIKSENLEFVSFVRSFTVEPKVPRISLNLEALSLMDLLVVLVFGEDKKEGIKKALKSFFKGNIAKKTISERITILITDQKI